MLSRSAVVHATRALHGPVLRCSAVALTLSGLIFADVTFTGPPVFTVQPNAQGGNGALVESGTLETVPGGFKYTDASLSYTTVAGDAGSSIDITWRIDRPFSVSDDPLVCTVLATIDGGLTTAGGAQPTHLFSISNSSTVIVGGAIALAADFSADNGVFFATDTSDQFLLVPGGYQLRQVGRITIDIPQNTPAGASYEFTLPTSSDTQLFVSGGTPVPLPLWSIAALALLLSLAGSAILRR